MVRKGSLWFHLEDVPIDIGRKAGVRHEEGSSEMKDRVKSRLSLLALYEQSGRSINLFIEGVLDSLEVRDEKMSEYSQYFMDLAKDVRSKPGDARLSHRDTLLPCGWCNASAGEQCRDYPHPESFYKDINVQQDAAVLAKEINAISSDVRERLSRMSSGNAEAELIKENAALIREKVALIRENVRIKQDAAFNCPGCGRHDYGLLAGAGARCRVDHEGVREQLAARENELKSERAAKERAVAVVNKLKKEMIDATLAWQNNGHVGTIMQRLGDAAEEKDLVE